jgi:hypothetical protein
MNYKEASEILIMSSSYEVFGNFLTIKSELDDKTYWRILSDAYIGSDNLFRYSNEIKQAFREDRDFRTLLMSKTDLKFYNNLPSKLIIYRGMTIQELESGDFGVSWTLSRKVAEFFANIYGRNHDTRHLPKVVHQLEVSKELICAYFSDRQEEEVIFLGN